MKKKRMPLWLTTTLAILFVVTLNAVPIVMLYSIHYAKKKEFKYTVNYMDSIESECADYSVTNELDRGAKESYLFIGFGNEEKSAVVQNKNIVAEKAEKPKCYNIKIGETEIVLDANYFVKNSATFNKIVKLWDDYKEGVSIDINEINVNNLLVFDDQLFVFVDNERPPATVNLCVFGCNGNMPTCAFRFDVTDYSLQYIGYSDESYKLPYPIKKT